MSNSLNYNLIVIVVQHTEWKKHTAARVPRRRGCVSLLLNLQILFAIQLVNLFT